MESDEHHKETKFIKKMIKFSIAGTLIFAVTGILWGMMTNSRMILLDGLYSSTLIGMSLLSLWVVHFVERDNQSETKRFPFGKSVAEAAIIFLKSLVVLGLVVTAVVFAIQDLLSGGRIVKINYTLAYVSFSALFCLAVYFVLREKGKNYESDLLKLEALEWKNDGLISLGSTLGFILAKLIGNTSVTWLIPYVDPLLVLVISAFLVKSPLKSMLSGLRELMRMAPEEKMQRKMEKMVSEIREKYRIQQSYCRVSKVGSALFIEIDFITDPEARIKTIKDTDRVREEIFQKIREMPYDPWLTVSFTEDEKWAI
ncbi:MAG: cation diffusion facilitator family transporter [Tindallia sp. MSAO_Bac2]|nr:MAG: cation diffusion facilitator family transporter [Tindallia sp. MSAO_Bac2]